MAKRPQYKQHGIRPGRICDWPGDALPPEELAALISYEGSAKHKTYPSPAGPPASLADVAKCETYPEASWPQLTEALRQGVKARSTGTFRGKFPERVWVWLNGVLHEARITNQAQGTYHGFPLDDERQFPLPKELLTERAPRVEF